MNASCNNKSYKFVDLISSWNNNNNEKHRDDNNEPTENVRYNNVVSRD